MLAKSATVAVEYSILMQELDSWVCEVKKVGFVFAKHDVSNERLK
jgi:hypothetical protein